MSNGTVYYRLGHLAIICLCAGFLCDIAESLRRIQPSYLPPLQECEHVPVDHTKELISLRRTLERMMLSDDWQWNK
jgi:hypothetical protein